MTDTSTNQIAIDPDRIIAHLQQRHAEKEMASDLTIAALRSVLEKAGITLDAPPAEVSSPPVGVSEQGA